MTQLYDQHARRAGALIDRAISERKTGYADSARATAQRARALASDAGEHRELDRLITEAVQVTNRLLRSNGQ